jgi:hypothetical protein
MCETLGTVSAKAPVLKASSLKDIGPIALAAVKVSLPHETEMFEACV